MTKTDVKESPIGLFAAMTGRDFGVIKKILFPEVTDSTASSRFKNT